MIQAYPHTLSVVAGETLTLHVGTDHPEFRVVLYRQGAALEQIADFGWQPTADIGFRPGASDTDWGWTGYDYDTQPDWASGAYIAMLWERNAGEVVDPDLGVGTAAGKFGKALFVVRSPYPGVRTPILYRVPIATYHAYNFTGGASLYNNSPGRATMRRPGGGTGGVVTDFPPGLPGMGDVDELDNGSSRQTFEHYDAKFIRWLESSGIQPDYCADVDCHGDVGLSQLTPYGVVISVGHDEYWSTEMRANLADYVAQGGNLAIFSGNTCWWRIFYDDDLSGFSCNRNGDVNNPQSDQWWIAALYDDLLENENGLIGASYRNGGGWWWPGRPQAGYSIQKPEHWVFEGVEVSEFGANESLIGYECDGAELTGASAIPGATAEATYNDGTPPEYQILGIGLFPDQKDWSLNPRDPNSATAAAAPFAATMGIYTKSGTVFNAAVVDWARVLELGEPTVNSVTKNVIGRLGGIRFGRPIVAEYQNLVALDGFYSADDGFRHIVAAQADGTLIETFFHPQQGSGQVSLGNFESIVDVAGFWSEDDQYRHAIVAQQDGTITEVFYHPQFGEGTYVLGVFPGVVSIAAFYSEDDNYRHVLVGTQDGPVREIFFHPEFGVGQTQIGSFENLTDLSGFYSRDDQFRHAIVIADGVLTEIFFNSSRGEGVVDIAAIPDAARVTSFYVGDDNYFSRRTVVIAEDGRVHEIRFGPDAGIIRSVIADSWGAFDVGGFWTPDDGFKHAILGDDTGASELFYFP